jgi:hypothetical protein
LNQLDFSILPQFPLNDVEDSWPRSRFCFSRGRSSPRMRQRPCSLAYRSCSRTKMLRYDRWYTWWSKSSQIPQRMSSWSRVA